MAYSERITKNRSSLGRILVLFLFLIMLQTGAYASDEADLVSGVSNICFESVPSSLWALDSTPIPIAAGDDDTSPRPSLMVASSSIGNGRVISVGSDGFLTNNVINLFDNKKFGNNVIDWLDLQNRKKIFISFAHGELGGGDEISLFKNDLLNRGYSIHSRNSPLTAGNLSDVGVLVIMNAQQTPTASEMNSIRDFVNNGGGLLLVGLGWSWEPYHPGKTLDDYPMNQIGQYFGVRWIGGYISDPTNNDNGRPLFHTFYPHIELQTLNQAFDYISDTTSAYESDLPDILQFDASIRNDYINSIKLIDSASADLGKDSQQRQEIYDFYIDLLNSHPQLYQRATIYNKDTQSVMAHIREKVYSSLINTQLYGDGLDDSEKGQISSAIGLSGRRLDIWNRFGVLLLDNNLLSSRQLDFLYNYLDALPEDIHNLHTISVLDFLGSLPSGTPGMGIWTKDGAINIFGTEIGAVSGNPFPGDVSPRVDDLFCSAVAHEVNHIVDGYNSQTNPEFAGRMADIISRAGCPHMNYLRSMFDDCFFANAPQEFFASIANQYFSDSCHTLELGVSRFQSGYHEPINQFLFYADAYSKGTGQTNFYKIDANGNIQRYAIPLKRDSNGHIRSLICDGKEYEFALDGEGYVQNITVKEIEPQGILYYPDFTDTANPDSWRSWLVLQNPNNFAAHADLEIWSRAGDLLYSGGQMISAHGVSAIRPRNVVGSDCAGSVVVTSDQPIVGSCQITRNSNEMCMGYNALDRGSTALYYPDFTDTANPDSWRSWLVLQNPGTSQASFNLKIRSRTGVLLYSGLLTIPAHGANAIRPRNLAGGDCAGSVVITSDQPIVGTCQITRNSNKMCMSYTASNQGSTALYYPDFTDTTNPDSWRSWLVLQNPTNSPASINLDIRSRAGDLLYSGEQVIPAQSVGAIRPRSLAGSDCAGSVFVTSDQPIVGTCQITRNNNEMCMSYNALDQGSSVLNYPDFTDTANSDSWRSWLVLQNPSASEAIVILNIRSRAGELLYSGPQAIPAQGVWAIRPRGLVGTDCSGSVTVTSDQPITGTCQMTRNNNLMCMSYTAAG